MNKNIFLALVLLTILLLFSTLIYTNRIQTPTAPKKTTEIPLLQPSQPQTQKTPDIIVDTPKPNDLVTNPLLIKGKAKGTWYFEGEFPVYLYFGDSGGFVNMSAFALGEWMTEDYVDFEVILNFPTPKEATGTVVLKKNNPSDLEENNDSLSIPVRFRD